MQKSGLKKEKECCLADEVWLPVKGYEGMYEVSSRGRVKSLDRTNISSGATRKRKGRMMSTHISSRGYCRLELCKEGVRKKYSVHRLVAIAFCGNKSKGQNQVNHIDFDTKHNCKSNLEWVTPKQNMEHSTKAMRMGPIKSPKVAKKLTLDDVRKIRALRTDGEKLGDIANMFDVSLKTIWNIVNGVTWKNAYNG